MAGSRKYTSHIFGETKGEISSIGWPVKGCHFNTKNLVDAKCKRLISASYRNGNMRYLPVIVLIILNKFYL